MVHKAGHRLSRKEIFRKSEVQEIHLLFQRKLCKHIWNQSEVQRERSNCGGRLILNFNILPALTTRAQCEKQRQIERDRRDLQDYAVRYFKDPEETELSTCAEFADDFVSEYPRFKAFPFFL